MQELFLATTSIVSPTGGILKHLSKAEALIELLDLNVIDYDAPVIRVTGHKTFDRFLAVVKKYHNYKDFATETLSIPDLIDYYKSIVTEMHEEMIANIYKYGKPKTDIVLSFEEEEKKSGETEQVLNLIEKYKDELSNYTVYKRTLILNRLFLHNPGFTNAERKVLQDYFQSAIKYPVAVKDNRKGNKNKWRVKYSDKDYSDESYKSKRAAKDSFTHLC